MQNKISVFSDFLMPDFLHILFIIAISIIIVGVQVTFICHYVVKTELKLSKLLKYVSTDVSND